MRGGVRDIDRKGKILVSARRDEGRLVVGIGKRCTCIASDVHYSNDRENSGREVDRTH